MERLLASSHFRTSRRCQSLLKYVVEAYLENHLDRVKERTIGIEVFGREPAYDTNQDSVVRTTAAEIRKKLAQYYLDPGHEHELRLLLPQGSYLPEFRGAAPVEFAQALTAAPPARRRVLAAGILSASMIAVLAGVLLYSRFHETDLDRYWKPMLEDRSDIVFCVGQPLRIYMFDGPRTDELNEKMVGSADAAPATADSRLKTTLNLLRAEGSGRPVLLGRGLSVLLAPGRVSGAQGEVVSGDRRPQRRLQGSARASGSVDWSVQQSMDYGPDWESTLLH